MKLVPLNAKKTEMTDELNRRAPFGTRDLIRWVTANDQRFNSNGAGIRSAARLLEALENAKDDDGAHFEDEDHQRLKEAVEDPNPIQGRPPYPCTPAARLVPFVNDIAEAKKPTSDGASKRKQENVS